jgi:enoyl-CoA hydratase/carnithine racemase
MAAFASRGDDTIKVLVFKSADPDYFIAHVDVTRIAEYRQEAAKLVGEASIALLFRHLSASRLVTIAQIEGRIRAPGNEFVLACDMRFAASETAIFAQPELAFRGLHPAPTRLMGRGRALEVMLSAQDYDPLPDLAVGRSIRRRCRNTLCPIRCTRPKSTRLLARDVNTSRIERRS